MVNSSPFSTLHTLLKQKKFKTVGSLYFLSLLSIYDHHLADRVAHTVTCPAADTCLTADPGVPSSIPVQSHTFVEIDHEIISKVILLPSADSRRVVGSYMGKYVHEISQTCSGKSVVR